MPVHEGRVGPGGHTRTWGREEPVLGSDHLRQRAAGLESTSAVALPKTCRGTFRDVNAQQIVTEPLLHARHCSGFGDTAVPKTDKRSLPQVSDRVDTGRATPPWAQFTHLYTGQAGVSAAQSQAQMPPGTE